VLVVVSNPVDILTHMAAHYAAKHGVPASRVIGTGTMLDTARFRALVGRHYGVDPQHVHAYVIGEHGDSEVLTWSQASIAGMKLKDLQKVHGPPLTAEEECEMDGRIRGAAYEIIAGKGATYYGVGSAVTRLVDVLLLNQRALLTICSRIDDIEEFKGLTLSLPRIVGGSGALAAIPPILNEKESALLRKSADVIRKSIAELKLD
jgi:L-lactate dehydrogenase